MTAKKLILVVDDDVDVRETLCEVLGDEGHEVACCANGREALKTLREHKDEVCLVLLDLMMPVMNGWDFRREQLADPAIAGVPVVVISAAPEGTEGLQAPVLSKPVTLDKVLQQVAAVC